MPSSDADPTLCHPAPAQEALTIARAAGEAGAPSGPLREGPGSHIGPYMILDSIGEGGFGSVFLAEQTHPVHRRVALKIIKLGMDTAQVVARFEQERQALAILDHPNIAKVFDAGATDTGRPYFAMELCTGEPIDVYCDQNNLSIRERLELFAQVCAAVQHAHTKGLIHRDIKPNNILVSSVDGRPSAKVIDFGIAKATSGGMAEHTRYTEHKQMIGTPEYMSPEQAEGSLDIDTRTDVYSLGILLYELLTGATPFGGDAFRGAPFAEIERIIREVEPPLPSTRFSRSSGTIAAIAARRDTEPRKLGTLIRGDLDWIVMKAIEKDRMRRYETANGLAMDIRRHLSGETVIAAPPSTAYRVRKFVMRNRVMVSSGAAVAAALLIGLLGFAWQARAARRAADTAERAAYQAQMVSAAKAVEDQRMDAAGALLAATAPRLRGWEYQHLVSRLDRSLSSPLPAEWRVTSFKYAASSGACAVRRINGKGSGEWVVLESDLRTERFVVPDTEYWSFEISPDGHHAAWVPSAFGDERPGALWSIDSKTVIATFPVRPILRSEVTRSVTWSPDGDRFSVCNGDGFQVFDGRNGGLIGGREGQAWAHFSGDGRWIFLHASRFGADADSRSYRLIDSRTFEPQTEVLHFDSATSGNGLAVWQSRIACTLEDGTLHLMEIVDGTVRDRLKIRPGIGVQTMAAWSRDGRFIAVGSSNGRVRVWEADSGNLVGDFAGPQRPISGLMFLAESGDLLACDIEGHHRVWPINSGASSVLTAHRSFVYPVVISKDGGLLLTGGWDGFVGHSGGLKLWDARTGTLVAAHGQPGEAFWGAALAPDDRYAVAAIWSDTESLCRTEVINLGTGAVVTTFKPRTDSPKPGYTIIHPDGRRAVSTYVSGEAYVWDIETGKVLWETSLGMPTDLTKEHTFAAAISRDGRLLAFGDKDLGIRLVNAETYADVRRWEAHTETVWSLSFSPDGKWLLSTSTDDTIGVWDVATSTLVARLAGHNADVFGAAVSPDGTRIASGGRDGYVRLWDTKNFENVAQLGGHKDYIYSLAWTPDGRQLISGSGDSTVRIWDTRTLAEQVAAARERSDALPGVEARIARARDGAKNPGEAVEALLASPGQGTRDRELARQVAARYASRGTPAYYRAPRASTAIVIDGKIDEAAWNDAPWSEPFVDIEGDAKAKPRFETRVRMLWDDTNLYIAAKLEEPHVWATLRNRDDIVFRDNDFEVFLDPEGDARWYGEVEVNALGTIFDLRLERPYLEGGPAHHEWSPPGMRAAAAVNGTLNDPSDTDRGWTVEIAIPYAGLADHASVPMPPRPGDVWRINFSRVEWQADIEDGRYIKRPSTPEDNWVWTPQHTVNMHIPREWGFVEFAPAARP